MNQRSNVIFAFLKCPDFNKKNSQNKILYTNQNFHAIYEFLSEYILDEYFSRPSERALIGGFFEETIPNRK